MSKTTPREHPYNAPDWLSRALAEDRVKRLTVPMEPQPEFRLRGTDGHGAWAPVTEDGTDICWFGRRADGFHHPCSTVLTPPYPPGSVIWFREALKAVTLPHIDSRWAAYAATSGKYKADMVFDECGAAVEWKWQKGRIGPGSMPRWACRHTRTVTDCRPVRLGELSGEDIAAEGIQARGINDGPPTEGDQYAEHKRRFAELWNAQHGTRHPWEESRCVWDVRLEHLKE